MKFWESHYTFNHPWETIAQAAWRKYPNPINPAVIGTDVIERKVVKGVLHTHRLVSSLWGFPKWAQALIGHANVCYASEWSQVDPVNKEMTLNTRNLTFWRHIVVNEKVKYTQDPTDPNKTLLVQATAVTVKGVPLTNYMEHLLAAKISHHTSQGPQALEWVINTLDTEMKDFADNAVKSTDEMLDQTRRQLDDLTSITKQSMGDSQNATMKSFDEIHNLPTRASSQSQTVPKI